MKQIFKILLVVTVVVAIVLGSVKGIRNFREANADQACEDDTAYVESEQVYVTGVTFPSSLNLDTLPVLMSKVYVNDEKEFLQALGADREIIIRDGAVINVEKLLDDESLFNDGTRCVVTEGYHHDDDSPFIYNEYVDDVKELAIANINNLTIRAEKNCSIVMDSTLAYILKFVRCHNVRLENINFLHKDSGWSDRGTLAFERCSNVVMNNVVINSWAGGGLVVHWTDDMHVSSSSFCDAVGTQVEILFSSGVTFADCSFARNEEVIHTYYNADRVNFERCRFYDNYGILFDLYSMISLKSCEIAHNSDRLGAWCTERVECGDDNNVFRIVGLKRDKNMSLSHQAESLMEEEYSQYWNDAALLAILGVKLPVFQAQVSEYTDADSKDVLVVDCYITDSMTSKEWSDLHYSIIDEQGRYVPEFDPYVTRRGWLDSDKEHLPDEIAKNTQVRIEISDPDKQRVTIEYRKNPCGKYGTKSEIDRLLKNTLGLNVGNYEITSYVNDFHAVLKLDDQEMESVITQVQNSEKWRAPRFAPEGHYAYFDTANKWQAELHIDSNMLNLTRSWVINPEFDF